MYYIARIESNGHPAEPWDDYTNTYNTAREAWDSILNGVRDLEDVAIALGKQSCYSALFNTIEGLVDGTINGADAGVDEDDLTGTISGNVGMRPQMHLSVIAVETKPTEPQPSRADKVRAFWFRDGHMGDPVGIIPIREPITDAPCQDGCLAPGSSPHTHTRIVGWELFGTKSRLTLNADMSMATRDTSMRSLDELDTDPYLAAVPLDL